VKYIDAVEKGNVADMTKKEYLAQLMLIIGIMIVFLIAIGGIYNSEIQK
jgi:hypothetical protein